MTNRLTDMPQLQVARVAGIMYLIALATALFASFYVRANLIVWGNAAETISNIMASERLFRLGLASDLVASAGIVVLASALYVLLSPISRNLALLALLWWIGEAVIWGIATLNDYTVLILLGDAGYLAAFETRQLQALVQLHLEAHEVGSNIALIFFGLGSTVFSYLLFKSSYIPRVLAAWGIFASLLILIGTFAILISPSQTAVLYRFINPPIALYELIAGLWLLFSPHIRHPPSSPTARVG